MLLNGEMHIYRAQTEHGGVGMLQLRADNFPIDDLPEMLVRALEALMKKEGT